MTTPSTHLTFDELDAIRTNEGTADQVRHLESCVACQSALADVKAIAADLRSAQASIAIPSAVDERIAWLAKKQAAAIRRSKKPSFSTRWAIAAGLILTLGAAGLWRSLSVPSVQIAATPALAGDVNGDGRIDILDAFALARTIETDRAAASRWDLDSDGAVNRHDVDLIAQSAVALGNG